MVRTAPPPLDNRRRSSVTDPRAPPLGAESYGLVARLVHAPAAERSAARRRLLLVVPDMSTRRAAAVGTHVAWERQTDVCAAARWAPVADFHRRELCKRLSHSGVQASLQRDLPTDSRSGPSEWAITLPASAGPHARTPTTSRYSASTIVRSECPALLCDAHRSTRLARSAARSDCPSTANARVVGP